MTKSEKNCTDMADVCELAHKRTVRQLKAYNLFHGTKHKLDKYFDGELMYGNMAQRIFDKQYDYICEVTGI